MLQQGRLTVPQLIEKTSLPENQIRTSLRILIQQNLANFTEEIVEGDTDNLTTYYQVLLNELLWRLRYPRFLLVARKIFGSDVRSCLVKTQ